MWARYTELLLAAGLAVCVILLGLPPDAGPWTKAAVWFGVAIVLLASGISFTINYSKAHLLNLAVGVVWVVAGWLGQGSYLINELTVTAGLTLLMFAIIPSRASEPPKGWGETLPAGAGERSTPEARKAKPRLHAARKSI